MEKFSKSSSKFVPNGGKKSDSQYLLERSETGILSVGNETSRINIEWIKKSWRGLEVSIFFAEIKCLVRLMNGPVVS